MNTAPLYIIATPIGNREDITLRALRLLKSAAIIAAEDTRRARQLLSLYDIPAPPQLLSLRHHNEARASERLFAMMEKLPADGCAVYLSDAGTPSVSDPGARLVSAARARGVAVVPIPGASALTAVLAVAGASAQQRAAAADVCVHFYGFVPAAARQRTAFLQSLRAAAGYHVVFESPHRIVQTLAEMARVLGDSCRLVLARELTKRNEQIVDASVGEIVAQVTAEKIPARGEFTLLIDIAQAAPAATLDADALFERLRDSLPPRQAASIAAAFCDKPATYFYQQHIKKTQK